MSLHPVTVSYEPMTALEVARLQTLVREEKAWETINWGNHGPENDQPVERKTLAECDTNHLEAILITQPHLGNRLRAAILELLRIRWKEQDG